MKLDEILASWENRPEAFTGQKVDTATFIGPNSASWQSGAYQEALKLEKKGVSPEDIWARTGTARSIDGKWRQEISDDKAYLRDLKSNTDVHYTKKGDKGRFQNTEGTGKGNLKIEDFLNHIVDGYGAQGAQEVSIGGGTLDDTLAHTELNKAYPGIGASRMSFVPSHYSDGTLRSAVDKEGRQVGILKGQHFPYKEGPYDASRGERDSRAFTTDGINILTSLHENGDNMSRVKRDGSRYNYDFVNEAAGIPKNKLERMVRQNLSRPNMNLVAPSRNEMEWTGGKGRAYNDIFDTILHENQHSVQSLEGFGMGNGILVEDILSGKIGDKNIALANKSYNNKQDERMEIYQLQPGEAEARLTGRRRMLNDRQRRQNFPFEQTQQLNKPNGTYGFDIDPVKAGKLWASHTPVDRPVIDPPAVIPGAKVGTPVNRPPRTSVEPEYTPPVEVAPPEQEPFIPAEPDFTQRPGYEDPTLPQPEGRDPYSIDIDEGTYINPDPPRIPIPTHYPEIPVEDIPIQTPTEPTPEGIPEDIHDHDHGHENEGEEEVLPPNETSFPWGKLFGGDMNIGEVWDAIPGTDIEDWKKKMPPVGEGVGGFMKEEMTEEEFNQLMEEMLRNGKIRSNR